MFGVKNGDTKHGPSTLSATLARLPLAGPLLLRCWLFACTVHMNNQTANAVIASQLAYLSAGLAKQV